MEAGCWEGEVGFVFLLLVSFLLLFRVIGEPEALL